MEVLADARAAIVDVLRHEIVGPAEGDDELIKDLPFRRYLMGTLYPITDKPPKADEDDVADDVGGAPDDADDVEDAPVVSANEWRPRSVGVSFFTRGGEGPITVSVWAARYELQRLTKQYRRIPLATPEAPAVVSVSSAAPRAVLFGGLAEVVLTTRPIGEGLLFTVTLVNSVSCDDDDKVVSENALYQAGFSCGADDRAIQEYPSVSRLTTDPEEQELQLVYRRSKTFAVGHGCAAMPNVFDGTPTSIRTEHLPSWYVPAVKTDFQSGDSALAVSLLARMESDHDVLFPALDAFVERYAEWHRVQSQAADVPSSLRPAFDRLMDRIGACVTDLRDGIKALRRDPIVRRAFALANRAMAAQMHLSRPEEPPRWRPFQLAFLLRVIPSIVDPTHVAREAVDLIWFPTGGGKTEAYLGAAALTIFHRRLTEKRRGFGTAIITRYTLRLLTTQQFERTARLICCCERVRRSEADLGAEAISVGLWVGGETSPNTYAEAAGKFAELRNAPVPHGTFQLASCPVCNHGLLPQKHSDDDEDYGVRATNGSFNFFCTSAECDFHSGLPVQIVDEALYSAPPTLLIATVDKFARLCWIADGGVFFGGKKNLPPSLIIQDELHLLSGPLGTTVAVYEAAIDELCRRDGFRPKIIASTATIRAAARQVRGLFGRTETRVFPPAGHVARDSYFAQEDNTVPARLYVGVMSQSHTSATSVIATASALLQAPIDAQLDGDLKDAYWTLVIYHNSLRELGRTINQARDDIRSRLSNMPRSHRRDIRPDSIVELTGNVTGQELPIILRRAEINAATDENNSVSIIACTNMLSVGIDVQRLGLMLMNGQPKTTAEYIQATSRVGRSLKRPGLVVTLYSATRPRDRSHYENFISYHGSFYRAVEPTSVTPYALPARERALHAALVICVRHGAGFSGDDEAIQVREGDPTIERWVARLSSRAHEIDPDEAAATEGMLRELLHQWSDRADAARRRQRPFHYAAAKQFPGLLRNYGDESIEGWQTMHSMRSVDRTAPVRIV